MAGEASDYLIRQFATAWRLTTFHLEGLTADDLRSTGRTRWPFQDRPFGDVVAWVNVQLTKISAEISYARFLHAASVR